MKSLNINLLSIILISCLGIIVYADTLNSTFHLDDYISIIFNPAVRSFYHLHEIWNFWPCRFVTYLSFALNYHFSGFNVLGYHLFNIAVHLLAAVLVWWLTLLTCSTPAIREEKIACHAPVIALFAGLVFVVHPVQTQAVTYIVQRAASLATLFYLLSLCLYVKSRLLTQAPSGRMNFYYSASLLTAIMAMFTKEITITLPLMILLYEFCFFSQRKDNKFYISAWKYLAPFLLTLWIIPLTMFLTKSVNFQEGHRVAEETVNLSSIHYFLTQLRVIVTYIRLLVLPFHQNLDYDYPVFKSIFEMPVLLSSLFLMAILYGATQLFSKYRLVSFSIFCFFLTLLPESSFLPIKDIIFEHRLYLPMLGYGLFLVSSIYYLFEKMPSRDHVLRGPVVVLSLIIACYAILAYQRNRVWKDDFTLWNDTVTKSPHKARPYNNRGLSYYKRGEFVNALFDYTKAIEIYPTMEEAFYNRGLIYEKQGRIPQALMEYKIALEIFPGFNEVYKRRGGIYQKQGKMTQALSDYDKVIALKYGDPEIFNNRSVIYANQGHFKQAISDLNRAIELNPDFAEAYNNRGNNYVKQDELLLALWDYNKAIEIDHNNMNAYNNRFTALRDLEQKTGN